MKIETGENNPILRKKSLSIKEIDQNVRKFANKMMVTMLEENGVGLAAPQIGENIRMFVIPEGMVSESVFINPEITKRSRRKNSMKEGCLSLPGKEVSIERSNWIKIRGINEKGEKFKLKVKGVPARVLQHEFDHLEGKLITDYE
ncbi:MAG: peptide deformylase [Candidatus Portnoybacteria bacterium]|nr:peptide deformylase [Candidatus Portnoybacteria bacterium]